MLLKNQWVTEEIKEEIEKLPRDKRKQNTTIQNPWLCHPMDGGYQSPLFMRFFQARVPELIAISFSRGSSWPQDQTHVSHIQADALLCESPKKP